MKENLCKSCLRLQSWNYIYIQPNTRNPLEHKRQVHLSRAIWKTWPDLTLSHHIASVTGTWRTGLLLLHLINSLCNHMGSGKSMVNKSTQFYTIPYNLALFALNLHAHKITTMLCWRQNNWQHNCIRELLSFTPGCWQS